MNRNSDIIFIHEVKVMATIGVAKHEMIAPQPLIISMDLETDIKEAGKTDNIELTVSYYDVANFVEDYVSSTKFKLLETLAESLITAIFSKFKLSGIFLKVEKPGAIIQTQKVGISIYRKRAQ